MKSEVKAIRLGINLSWSIKCGFSYNFGKTSWNVPNNGSVLSLIQRIIWFFIQLVYLKILQFQIRNIHNIHIVFFCLIWYLLTRKSESCHPGWKLLGRITIVSFIKWFFKRMVGFSLANEMYSQVPSSMVPLQTYTTADYLRNPCNCTTSLTMFTVHMR